MEIEQLQFIDFIASCYPFDSLPYSTLATLTASLEITYHRKDDEIFGIGHTNKYLYLIRSGAVDLRKDDGSLASRQGEGDSFGGRSLIRAGKVEMQAVAIEDSLLYLIPEESFQALIAEAPTLKEHFMETKAARIKNALEQLKSPSADNGLGGAEVSKLSPASALVASPELTVKEAANMMTKAHKRALLVIDNEKLTGIVTDSDFRKKVVASGLSLDTPIKTIMTPSPYTVDIETSGTNALLLMLEHNIQYLPVLTNGEPSGVLSAVELLNLQSLNAVSLASRISQAKSRKELAKLSAKTSDMMVNLVERGLRAHDVANAVSLIGESVFKRAVALATKKLGPPPCDYAYVTYGSMARRDQTAHSDQDNGLILANDIAPEDEEYFIQLATITSDTLDACGYIYCPGDVMATNHLWRQTLKQWKSNFDQWIDAPEPKSLMYASIFFDMRHIAGSQDLSNSLAKYVRKKAQSQSLFLSHMMSNALKFRPPIGLFRQFVLDSEEGHSNTLNLKMNGITPVTDLMRVHALAAKTQPINTRDRIKHAAKTKLLSKSGARDLLDALEFISTVRLQHQARQIAEGIEPDNHVSPDELSSLERRHLRDAFDVINTLQKAGATSYNSGSF